MEVSLLRVYPVKCMMYPSGTVEVMSCEGANRSVYANEQVWRQLGWTARYMLVYFRQMLLCGVNFSFFLNGLYIENFEIHVLEIFSPLLFILQIVYSLLQINLLVRHESSLPEINSLNMQADFYFCLQAWQIILQYTFRC